MPERIFSFLFLLYLFFSSLDRFDLIRVEILIPVFAVILLFRATGREKIRLPSLVTILFFLFFVFLLFSTLQSFDKEESLKKFFFYLSLFYIFIYFFNNKVSGRKFFDSIIRVFSPLFVFVNLLFILFIRLKFVPGILFFVDGSGLRNLVIPSPLKHNHLGDFLGLTLIYFLTRYLQTRDKKNLLFFLFYFVFFLFSYSRSAYFSFLTATVLLFAYFVSFKNLLRKDKLFVFFFSILTFIFIFISVFLRAPYLKNYSPIAIFNVFLSSRLDYFQQVKEAFLEKPFFGWGLTGFGFASRRFVTDHDKWTGSAHNFLLEILVESGLPAVTTFSIFIAFILYSIFRKKSLYGLYFIYLILNFQIDYTYKIPLMLVLFFMSAALSCETERIFKSALFLPLFSVLTAFLSLRIFLSYLFLDLGQTEISRHFFPLNKTAFEKEIKEKFRSKENYQNLLNNYLSLYSNNPFVLKFAADLCREGGDRHCEIHFLEKILPLYHFSDNTLLGRIYELKRETASKEAAAAFLGQIYREYRQKLGEWIFARDYKESFDALCRRDFITSCGVLYFYKPEPSSQEKTDEVMPYQAVYHFNNHGFHDLDDYQIQKGKETFRIVVLGDGTSFGFLNNTKDIWTERLEERLNNEKPFKGFKNYEVLNLSYHNYDFASQAERFRIQGKDFNPDLIIWFNNDFLRINNLFFIYLDFAANDFKKGVIKNKENDFFPVWSKAYEDYRKDITWEKIVSYQKDVLKDFFDLYHGRLLFLNSSGIPDELRQILEEKGALILTLSGFDKNQDFHFERIWVVNPRGQQKIADSVYDFLLKNQKKLFGKMTDSRENLTGGLSSFLN